ncbi:MAG: sugar phosphate isomerase/epimerase family protein [Bacteroidota bacterium]
MYKYGVHAYLWSAELDRDIPWIAHKAKEFGFDALELPLNVIDRIDVKLTRQALEDESLQCTCVGGIDPDADLISDSPKERQAGLDHLKRCIDVCVGVGSQRFGGVIYSAWGRIVGRPRTPEEWERSVTGLRQAAEYARVAGVKLGLEPVNRFESYFLNTTEDGLRLLEDIGLDNVDLNLDTFHMNVEERDFYGAIKAAGCRLGHLHTNENDRGTPGKGHVDWVGVFRALQEIGYQGHLVIESFVPGIGGIAEQCAIWRQLAPDGDYLAREGLRFLKETEARVAAGG